MIQNLIDRIKLPFRKDRELLSSLYDIIGFYPHKTAYYKLALMHKSIGHRSTADDIVEVSDRKGNGKKAKGVRKGLGRKLNNERLEFLGDAILDAVVGDIVYRYYPGKPEGFLTNTRSKLVQRETLGKLAQQVGLTRLILSSGRSASHNSYMGGNAFEALVGAIYLDRGYDACMTFMQDRILGRYINIDKMAFKEVNFKSKLIEWTQKNRIQMEFRLEGQSKDQDGSPTFKYTAVLETVEGGTAEGFSKKESQQKASEITLKRLKADKAFLDSVFAAKTERTKMDEDLIQVVPDMEQPAKDEFLILNEETPTETPVKAAAETAAKAAEEPIAEPTAAEASLDAELETLDDIQAQPRELSREEIIAAAEAEAYSENSEQETGNS